MSVFSLDKIYGRTVAPGGATPLGYALQSTFEEYMATAESRDRLAGVKTGFADLDNLTGGLRQGQVVVVSAEPNADKRAFLLNMVLRQAMDGVRVMYLSLGQTADQVAQTLLHVLSGVPAGPCRKGDSGHDDWQKLAEATELLAKADLLIHDRPPVGLEDLHALMEGQDFLQARTALFIDDINFIDWGGCTDRRERLLALLSFARRCRIPVVLAETVLPGEREANEVFLFGCDEVGLALTLCCDDRTPHGIFDTPVAVKVYKTPYGEMGNFTLSWDASTFSFSEAAAMQG